MDGGEEELSDFHKGQILNEGLILVREDICDWINELFQKTVISKDSFLVDLSSGVILCDLLKKIQIQLTNVDTMPSWWNKMLPNPNRNAKYRSFPARENISNFLDWCRSVGMKNTILFETRGLVNKDEEKNVVLTLLHLAESLSSIQNIPLPEFAKFYRQFIQANSLSPNESHGHKQRLNSVITLSGFDDSLSIDSGVSSARSESNISESASGNRKSGTNQRASLHAPKMKMDRVGSGNEVMKRMTTSLHVTERKRVGPNYIKNHQHSVGDCIKNPRKLNRSASASQINYLEHEMREISKNRCTCEDEFIIEKSTMQEGMYRIGKSMKFVRIFRGTIVVRIGGGWETFHEYINKVDPCKQKSITNKPLKSPVQLKNAIKSDYLSSVKKNTQQ